MKFQWYNSRVLQNFKVLCRLSVSLSVHLKDDCKILVAFKQIQNIKVSHFWMAKVKKVNITFTYPSQALPPNIRLGRKWPRVTSTTDSWDLEKISVS
jgi:hypothetical protein